MPDKNWATNAMWGRDMDIYEDMVDFTPLYADPETGRAVSRTPQSHPYSFSSYILWQHPSMSREEAYKVGGNAYSDRLYQWDWDKCERLYKKHQGDSKGRVWENPRLTQAFLREYMEDPELVLTMIIACCNASSGFPLWAFMWKPGKEAK